MYKIKMKSNKKADKTTKTEISVANEEKTDETLSTEVEAASLHPTEKISKQKTSTNTKRDKIKYQCDVCQKGFQGLNDLRKHLRIHSDERPYP